MTVPGDCIAVCAGCREPVIVPVAGGSPPWITHERGCANEHYPVQEAVRPRLDCCRALPRLGHDFDCPHR